MRVVGVAFHLVTETPLLDVTQERPFIGDHWKTPVFLSFQDAPSNEGIQIN